MPNNHLFTVSDSNPTQIKTEDDSRLFIPVNDPKTNGRLSSLYDSVKAQEERTDLKDMAPQKPSLRRPRSQTLPSISTAVQRRNSAKRIETPGSIRTTKSPLRLTKSLEFEPQHKRETKSSGKRARSLLPNTTRIVSFGEPSTSQRNDTQRLNYNILSKGRPSVDITRRSSVTNIKKQPSRSYSIPSDDLNSIYSIVKARSLALKWYRNGLNGGVGKAARLRRKQSVALPTIMDDKKNISLCKAKCSPQFAQVVHLLQDEVDKIEDDLQVLSIE